MDDRRFDDLIRSLSLKLPRRSLGPLGAALLAALGATDADAERRRDRDHDRDRNPSDQERDAAPRAGTGPEAAKKKRRKKKKPKPPTCSNFGAFCTSSYSCCGALYCYDSRCAYSGTNPCPDDQYDCGGTCSWSSTCCPTGQKLCNGVCVAQSACCPACGPGQTCVNGTCTGGGGGGCAAGTLACEGLCLPAGSCCPTCAAGEYCDAGTCRSLECNASELDACLADVAALMAETRETCQAACADPESPSCITCLWDWIFGPEVSPYRCHAQWCSATAPQIRNLPQPAVDGGTCQKLAYQQCYRSAYDMVDSEFTSGAISPLAGALASCLSPVTAPVCEPLLALAYGWVATSATGVAIKFYKAAQICERDFGCSRSGLFRYCVVGDRCCHRPGYAFHGGTCCRPEGICGSICCVNLSEECRDGRCVPSSCPQGARAVGDECCLPQCAGKCGGDDGCGGTCPNTCPAGQTCVASCDGVPSRQCFQQQACPPDLCGTVNGPCNTVVPCIGSCAAYWDHPDYTCNVGANNVARCGCPPGLNDQGPKCCPEGKPVTCLDNRSGTNVYECCDAHGCEKNYAEYGVWGCCAAEHRTTNRFGQPDCCSQGWVPGHPVGFPEDGCCLPTGSSPIWNDFRLCCNDLNLETGRCA